MKELVGDGRYEMEVDVQIVKQAPVMIGEDGEEDERETRMVDGRGRAGLIWPIGGGGWLQWWCPN